jgi:hypothetical protein
MRLGDPAHCRYCEFNLKHDVKPCTLPVRYLAQKDKRPILPGIMKYFQKKTGVK